MTEKYIVESLTILSRIEGIPRCLTLPGLRPTQTMIRKTKRSVDDRFFCDHKRTTGQGPCFKLRGIEIGICFTVNKGKRHDHYFQESLLVEEAEPVRI